MKQTIDNFSQDAADYAAYRPASPDGIFDFLYSHVKSFNTAWDCGTGNGQVAVKLAARFKTVYATDISEEQLGHAPQKDNIIYKKERAEQTSLEANSVDLITVAQAIHWFDFNTFYKEVGRVARPGAIVAAWTYSFLQLTPSIDRVLNHLYKDITRPYWDKEREYVDAKYATIPFPFKEIAAPEFGIIKDWTLAQLVGYLRTWSGVQHYIQQEQRDPVALVMKDLQKAWGDADTVSGMWPVHVRAGRVNV